MIFVNPRSVNPPAAWCTSALALTATLKKTDPKLRSAFIDEHRDETWGNPDLLRALRAVVGNKCWYSEVPLDGADPNVDHFRPKGRVREVNEDFTTNGRSCEGYWWLAFDVRNFRLASMHSNQRRVDADTDGGKWDFFPVLGERAPEGTDYACIVEEVLPLDPCSQTDVRLLWFDPDGRPCCSEWRRQLKAAADGRRVRATIWLYHLDKTEIQMKRAGHMASLRADLNTANSAYLLWNREGSKPNLLGKALFDQRVAEIRSKMGDREDFAGAKQCAVRAATAEYDWVDEFLLL